MTSDKVRTLFLEFFRERGHKIVPSHSLIPPADPTLLFVNAGMVQFKDVFTGRRDLGFRRAATTQKCLRVSGKHNDLEQVGRTPRHHTFFEMLGNFSFGDYFKREAILYAWELLTEVYGLRPEQLLVTVHPEDLEARRVWIEEVGLPESRVFSDPSNFWAMGETGPCGPCSEIHIDRGPDFEGSHPIEDPGERFMELWNLVFMQFERGEDGSLSPLPAPSIDTGMGLERVSAVLQGVRSNFETDLFMPLMQLCAGLAGVTIGEKEEQDVALRVIADHARATAFLISEGIFPENEGRGYVLRRLMRRALRFGHKLGLRGPFFTKVCLKVVEVMGAAWPELVEAVPIIERVAGQEEERFLRTLSSGMELLERALSETKAQGKKVLDGKVVFTLYDTHGFPVDLTSLVAGEQGIEIDMEGFEAEMEAQRERGRMSWKGGEGYLEDVAKTCEGLKVTFTGYEVLEDRGIVIGLFSGDEEKAEVDRAKAPSEVLIITDRTPFYGEAGGQVGDTGVIEWDGGRAVVLDTKKPREGLIVHVARLESGSIEKGMEVALKVDGPRRRAIMRHHSATHILHHALRLVLGSHVRQRGSLVAPDRLRFDFSHPTALTDEEIARIEDVACEMVLSDHKVEVIETTQEDAIRRGALHFFEDKYGDWVRMVVMGDSKELCGGTHVSRTGEVGPIKVLSETGISAGVRRIEAVAGFRVLEVLRERERLIKDVASHLKCDPSSLADKVAKLTAQVRSLERELKEMQVRFATSGGRSVERYLVGDLEVLWQEADGVEAKALRELADALRQRLRTGFALITKREDETTTVVLAATKDVSKEMPAGNVLKALFERLGEGRGGGNPMLAQGVAKAEGRQILDTLREVLRSLERSSPAE